MRTHIPALGCALWGCGCPKGAATPTLGRAAAYLPLHEASSWLVWSSGGPWQMYVRSLYAERGSLHSHSLRAAASDMQTEMRLQLPISRPTRTEAGEHRICKCCSARRNSALESRPDLKSPPRSATNSRMGMMHDRQPCFTLVPRNKSGEPSPPARLPGIYWSPGAEWLGARPSAAHAGAVWADGHSSLLRSCLANTPNTPNISLASILQK